jgi:hypothetical protein
MLIARAVRQWRPARARAWRGIQRGQAPGGSFGRTAITASVSADTLLASMKGGSPTALERWMGLHILARIPQADVHARGRSLAVGIL